MLREEAELLNWKEGIEADDGVEKQLSTLECFKLVVTGGKQESHSGEDTC